MSYRIVAWYRARPVTIIEVDGLKRAYALWRSLNRAADAGYLFDWFGPLRPFYGVIERGVHQPTHVSLECVR